MVKWNFGRNAEYDNVILYCEYAYHVFVFYNMFNVLFYNFN